MRLNETITTYESKGKRQNQETGEYEEVAVGINQYSCNISVVKDYVNDVQQGRVTGKTIKVRFINPVPKFTYAEWEGRDYKTVGVTGRMHLYSVEMEEV